MFVAFFALWGAVAFAFAGLMLLSASSAAHVIEAGIALLIGTLSFAAGCIVRELRKLRKLSKNPASFPHQAEVDPGRMKILEDPSSLSWKEE